LLLPNKRVVFEAPAQARLERGATMPRRIEANIGLNRSGVKIAKSPSGREFPKSL